MYTHIWERAGSHPPIELIRVVSHSLWPPAYLVVSTCAHHTTLGCTGLWYDVDVTGGTTPHSGHLLRTKGSAWGPRRVEVGISMNELSRRTGIQKADLARIENGRMVPTWEEYTKVAAVLGLPGSAP